MKKRIIFPLFLLGALTLAGCGTAPDGIHGPQGEQGQKGETGPAGKDGSTILTGTGAPAITLGKKDDIYLDTGTNDLYLRNETSWKLIGNIKGDKGEEGSAGAAGSKGESGKDGSTIITGTGVPTSNIGKANDVYLDTTTKNLYLKGDTSWKLIGELKGETGPAGSDGSDGENGKDGATILTGKGLPSSTTGKKDDLYLDTDTNNLYVKTDTEWSFISTIKGEKGDTPVVTVGPNGNWFIDGVDSTVPSGKVKDQTNDPNTSTGFSFSYAYDNNQIGLIINEYFGSDIDVVMPNTIDNLPIIGYSRHLFNHDDTMRIRSIKMSKNIVRLQPLGMMFENLEKIDLNNAPVTSIPRDFIRDARMLDTIILSDTVKTIEAFAFSGCGFTDFDFKNVERIGESAFADNKDRKTYESSYFYIPKTVKTIDRAFPDTNSLYLEASISEEGYDYFFSFDSNSQREIIYNISKNENFLYEVIEGNPERIIVHKDLVHNDNLVIPSQIDGKDVVATGDYSFSLEGAPTPDYTNRDAWAYEYVELPTTMQRIGDHAFANLTTSVAYIPKRNSIVLRDTDPMNQTFSPISIVLYERGEDLNLKSVKLSEMVTYLNKIVITDRHELILRTDDSGEKFYYFLGFTKNAKDLTTISTEYAGEPIKKIVSNAIAPTETDIFFIPDTQHMLYIKPNGIFASEMVFIPKIYTDFSDKAITTNNVYVSNNDVFAKLSAGSVVNMMGQSPAIHEGYKGMKADGKFLIAHRIEETLQGVNEYGEIFKYDNTKVEDEIIDIRLPRQINNVDITGVLDNIIVLQTDKTYNIYVPRNYLTLNSGWIGYGKYSTINIYTELSEQEVNERFGSLWLDQCHGKVNLTYNHNFDY